MEGGQEPASAASTLSDTQALVLHTTGHNTPGAQESRERESSTTGLPPAVIPNNQSTTAGSATIPGSDSDDSSLSEIDNMLPPTAELRQLAKKHKEFEVECTHTTWCTCPMHASYSKTKAAALPHISSWGLAALADEEPESCIRGTANIRGNGGGGGDGDFVNTRFDGVRKEVKALLAALPTLQIDDQALHNASQNLVHALNSYFKPAKPINSRPSNPMVSIIELLEDAAVHWQKQGHETDQLVARFWHALETHPNFAMDLEAICPLEMRKGRVAALKVGREKLVMRDGFEEWMGRKPSGWRFRGFP